MQKDAAPEESSLQERQDKTILFLGLKIEIVAKGKEPGEIKSEESGALSHVEGGGLGLLCGMENLPHQDINLVKHGRFEYTHRTIRKDSTNELSPCSVYLAILRCEDSWNCEPRTQGNVRLGLGSAIILVYIFMLSRQQAPAKTASQFTL